MAGDEQFDVVVVGARCAGAPLALDLANRGLRVCLIDRARFPSEVPSTHVIHPNGVSRLAELGMLKRLLATGAPPVVGGSFTIDDVSIEMPIGAPGQFEAPWLCIRRIVLDQLLLDAAAEGGVEVRTQTVVDGLVKEDGVVKGVEVKGQKILCDLVVGADGPRSAVARLVGAETYQGTPQGKVFLWGYFEGSDAPQGHSYLGVGGRLGFLAFPTDAGLYLAGVAVPKAERESYLRDTEAGLRRGLGQVGAVGEYVRPFPLVGPVRVMSRWEGFFRQATGPGWVLVGDAGHFKDPTPAQGISDAFRQGKKLAGVIEAGLGDGQLAPRLHRWWRWRDEDAWEMYWFAADVGADGHQPQIVRETVRDLAARPDGAERLMRVINHELKPSELFTAWLGIRALLRAGVTHPGQMPQLVREAGQATRDDVDRRRRQRRLRYPDRAA